MGAKQEVRCQRHAKGRCSSSLQQKGRRRARDQSEKPQSKLVAKTQSKLAPNFQREYRKTATEDGAHFLFCDFSHTFMPPWRV